MLFEICWKNEVIATMSTMKRVYEFIESYPSPLGSVFRVRKVSPSITGKYAGAGYNPQPSKES